jgi:hypothetical protein
MANTTLTASVIAKKALAILENNLVMGGLVYRGYEEEFSQRVNGYTVGDTINIRRPTDFTVRDGRTASSQDVVEGKIALTVNKQKGIDFEFTTADLSLNIDELGERVIRPGMVQLGNQIDRDIASLYMDVWNWVGTPGSTIDSFADFAKGPERLDLSAVMQDARSGVLSPSDYWAMAGSQTALYMQDVAKGAYRDGKVGDIGNVPTYMTQNVQTLTAGTRNQTATMQASQSTTYVLSKDTQSMTIATGGWTQSTSITQGEVFTIAGVFAVNPVTKATLAYLQPFVVKATVTTTATTATTTLTISPPIISTGAFQTVSAAPAQSATITILGTATVNYPQNMVFHKNAFALAMVPMVRPPGAVDCSRQSYKGYSVRVVPFYDGISDISKWRLDVLYGVRAIDPRLAVRVSGS